MPLSGTASPTGSFQQPGWQSQPPMTMMQGSLSQPIFPPQPTGSLGSQQFIPTTGSQQIEGPTGLRRQDSQRSVTAPGDGGGRMTTGLVQMFGSTPGLQPRSASQDAGVRSLPVDRVSQHTGRDDFPASSPPPAMFRTAAVPQMQAQDSTASLSAMGGLDDDSRQETEFLNQRVDQLERTRDALEQQLSQYRNAPPPQSQPQEDVELLQRRLVDAQQSEARALQSHEARLRQIDVLQQQLASGAQAGQDERLIGLQQQLEAAKASEASHRRKVQEQAAMLQTAQLQAMEVQRTKSMSMASEGGGGMRHEDRLELEDRFAAALREKENQTRSAEQRTTELMEAKASQTRDMREMEQQIATLKKLEDAYQKQLQDDRKTIADLQSQVESGSKTTDFHASQHQGTAEHIQNLEGEVSYLKTVETYHMKQSDTHRKEVARLKRLREEDAPRPLQPRMPLKALEERVMQLACFTMMGVIALPIMGAIALLNDENYVFWMGRTWPWMIIGGCTFVFFLFVFTVQGLYSWALPEHRSQFTMAFTWATFAAFLGIILVPLSLMANKDILSVASTVSQGCMTAMPQSELLVDYSQVLYNIRLSANCSGEKSVMDCQGWGENKYTMYLAYLEEDMQCGPLCPESPPPARSVHAPSMNFVMPTVKPTLAPAPLFGPPVQFEKGLQPIKGTFLQAGEDLAGRHVQLHEHKASELQVPNNGGIMEHAVPHVQARKLFSKGTTRMSCYPLIATRLQVLVSTFGGLWYWEGIGLIIISLLTSLVAGMYFAVGMA